MTTNESIFSPFSKAIVLCAFLVILNPNHSQGQMGLWAGGRELQNFPLITQPDQLSCGPTCCAMVLKYHGVSAGIGPLKTQARTQWISGPGFRFGMTFPAGVVSALEAYRVLARVDRGDLNSIVTALNQNHAPILLVRSGNDTWHYIVAIGYMHGTSFFKVADPALGQAYWMRGDDLASIWNFSYAMGDHFNRDETLKKDVLTVKIVEGRRCRTCGGDGNSLNVHCFQCGGDGRIGNRYIGRTCSCNGGRITAKCVTCGGDGKETDYFRKGVESAGVKGSTMIIPFGRNMQTPNSKSGTSAGQEYAVTTLRNSTPYNINFGYRWGNGEWKKGSLAPGGSTWYSWTYNSGSFASPAFQVSFDFDLGNATSNKTYDLERYRTMNRSVEAGYPYHFSLVGPNRIELYATK